MARTLGIPSVLINLTLSNERINIAFTVVFYEKETLAFEFFPLVCFRIRGYSDFFPYYLNSII